MKTRKNNSNGTIFLIIAIIITIVIAFLTFKNSIQSESSEYKIVLQGNKYLKLEQGEEYIEPGFLAYKNNIDVTNEVKVVNEIKDVPGIYKIYYQLDDYIDYRIVEIKRVIDSNLVIELDVNINEKTNKDIIININVYGETFDSIILPDNSIIYSNIATYKVIENGIYKFVAMNTNNETFTKEIEITNIDKEAPIGTCTATLLNNKTIINVNSSEEKIYYNYYDNNVLIMSSEDKEFTINNKTSDNIKVILKDDVSNENTIICKIIDNRYYEQVKPDINDKIVYHGDSETLKTYIVNRGSYYMTYIWVKDAYSQLNKYNSPEYGKNLYVPSELLKKANTEKNLNNKIIIGFNASAFYLKDIFDAASVRAYPQYDKTSVGTLVITDGKVTRNAYQYAVKTWYIVGVNKDNQMLVFEDIKSDDANLKLNWSQIVINSGIRNTFTFAAPLIQNGIRTNITTSMPGDFTSKKGLQLICQINDNNFLLFTSSAESRNKAIDEFLKLGCKTAMNLDGGGSIALVYKDKNSSEIIKVIGNGRALPEVGYFTE